MSWRYNRPVRNAGFGDAEPVGDDYPDCEVCGCTVESGDYFCAEEGKAWCSDHVAMSNIKDEYLEVI